MDSVGSQRDIGTPIVSNGFVAPLSNFGSVDWFYEPVCPSRPLTLRRGLPNESA